MSFAARTLLSSDGGAPVSSIATSVSAYSGAAVSASVTLTTTGVITTTGNASYTEPYWFVPPTTGIGSSYWVKFTLTGGSAWDAGLLSGTVYALSSSRTLQWTQSTVGAKVATVTGSIYADAGGTVLVGTQYIDVDVERF